MPHVVTSRDPDTGQWRGLEPLRERLVGQVTVLVGHSGVGKSTLVNALVPGAGRATGVVNDVTGRGRHTSSSAVALRLPGDEGWVIDTPGVRSFGLAHVEPARIIYHFPDLAAGTDDCPRGCTHDEEECALDAWVESGRAGPAGPAGWSRCAACCAPAPPTPRTDSLPRKPGGCASGSRPGLAKRGNPRFAAHWLVLWTMPCQTASAPV